MNSKMYRIGFFALLTINIALMVLFVLGPKPPRPEGGGPESGIKDEISRELGFTEAQKARFDEMAINHREAIRSLEDRERKLIKTFFEQLASTNANGNKEEQLQEILQLERDKIMVTYNHFEELRGICNEEQLTRFDKVMERVVPVLTNSSERPMQRDKPRF